MRKWPQIFPMPPPDKSRNQKLNTRRTAGRADRTPESDLTVSLVPRSGDPVRLEWSDISVAGTKILAPAEFGSDLVEGAPVRLCFGVEDLNFRVNGRVVWCHDTADEAMISVGVDFAYLDPTISETHPELWVYFNRRKAFRVTPPLGEVLEVELSGPQGSASVRLVDISATGVSVTLPDEHPTPAWVENGLGHKFDLHLTLLPEVGEIKLVTRAERVFRQGKADCWGLSILEEDERHLGDSLEIVEEYIMARQRQMRGVEG